MKFVVFTLFTEWCIRSA